MRCAASVGASFARDLLPDVASKTRSYRRKKTVNAKNFTRPFVVRQKSFDLIKLNMIYYQGSKFQLEEKYFDAKNYTNGFSNLCNSTPNLCCN